MNYLPSLFGRLLPAALLSLAMLLPAAATAQIAAPPHHEVATGRLDYYPQFPSTHIAPRDVNVWLPPGYDNGKPCDVVYMHDGQMLFDDATTWNHQEWEVDEVAGRMLVQDAIRPCIIVGIDNIAEQRYNEYFPQKVMDYARKTGATGGGVEPDALKADQYLQFLVNELKPFVDSHYRTLSDRDHTFVMGSSMGGLISMYALCEYPDVFGGAACMSTHLPLMLTFAMGADPSAWAEAFRLYVADHLPAPNTRLLYMDRGTVELDGMYAPFQDAMDALLRSKGWDSAHLRSNVFDGHRHMETYWALRLDQPLRFLLQPAQ